jgi:hypothetical protein
VIHNSRRWWYQPQAIVREKSGLTESPAVWFFRTILRAHGYDHASLQLVVGKQVTTSSWQVGDVVVPKKIASDGLPENRSGRPGHVALDRNIGRIIAETSNSTSSLTARGRASGSVLVEFVSKTFAESASIQTGSSFQDSLLALETRRVPVTRLVHSTNFHGTGAMRKYPSSPFGSYLSETKECQNIAEDMDIADSEHGNGLNCSISDKAIADMKKIAKLDVAAIENVTHECKKNATTLAGLFAAGLPDVILSAADSAIKKVHQRSEGGESLAQAMSSLGKLALAVVERAFPDETLASEPQSSGRTSQESTEFSSSIARQEPIDEVQGQRNVHRHMRNDQRGSRSTRGSDSALLQEVGRAGQLSSLQHRRSMLLALMSRARPGNTGSMNDIMNREAHGYSREASIGNMMPPLDPFRQDAAALLHNPSGEFPSGGSWDGQDEDESSTDNATDSVLPPRNRRALRSAESHEASLGNEPSVLDSVLRGRTQKAPSHSSGGKSSVHSAVMKTVILSGLLGNSLSWLKTSLDSQSKQMSTKQSSRATPLLQSACDEDGTPLLQLAIALGCSDAILRHLVRLGTPVGETEIKMAASMDQPESLSILLQSSVYSEGLVDVDSCSPAVANVIRDASRRQQTQHKKLRLEAASFLACFLRRLLQLGLSSRHQRPANDLCSRAVAGALVGSVVLGALQKKHIQAMPSSTQPAGATFSSQDESDPQSGGRHDAESVGAARGSECQGLLHAMPDEVLGKTLVEKSMNLTNLLLFIEDYLCSKDINDSAIGLTLLLTLLERYPSFHLSSEMERHGLSELVSSHDAFASNRLAEISARVTARESVSAQELAEAETRAASGVVTCPKKHAAALHVTRHSSFRCDLCGKGVERGRVMHGCRECDWDACERCTDRAEGGIVKWNHIRELASGCQRLISGDDSFMQTSKDANDIWGQKMVETMSAMDNSTDINNLSIRLLQRDRDSIKDLGLMMNNTGQLTMHQFLSVILPALHASLMGRPSGKGGLNLNRPSFCRRSKKPRVVGSRARAGEESLYGSSSGDRMEFVRDILKYLVADAAEEHIDEAEICDESTSKSDQDENDIEDEGNDDGMDGDGGMETNQHSKKRMKRTPELLRRLHQVLALYENVTLPPNARPRQGSSGPRGGELQSLSKPIELCLVPLPSGNQLKSRLHNSNALAIHGEPLMSVEDLSRYVLRTSRVSHPYYVAFCRR